MYNPTSALGLALALMIFPASIRASDVSYSIAGFEDMTCGAWVSGRQVEVVRAQYTAWFRGFISGHNFANPQRQIPIDLLPSEATLVLYVDRHCDQDPLSTFPAAAFRLVNELSARR